jgi:ribosome biogenesis protein ERB1
MTDDPYHATAGPGRLFDVPGYQGAVRGRSERCRDLYLCPREIQTRVPDTSAELLPELPDLEELRPYPTVECVRYVGHTARVRCVDVSPTGAFVASGSSDGELRIWELQTGWCMPTIKLSEFCENGVVTSVSFCPSGGKPIVAASCGRLVFLIRMHEDDFEFPAANENFSQVAPNILSISHARVLEMRQCVFNRSGIFLAILGQSRMVLI